MSRAEAEFGGISLPDAQPAMRAQSTRPERVQRSRVKGWRIPPNTVVVSRPSKWGNPFDFRDPDHCWTAISLGCRADPAGRQAASVVAFRRWLAPQPKGWLLHEEFQVGFGPAGKLKEFVPIAPRVYAGAPPTHDEIRAELGGRNLACWCKIGAPCHADVLLEIANSPLDDGGEAVHENGQPSPGLNQNEGAK